MTKKHKYLLAGWLLFLAPLAVQIVNIYLSATANASSPNREFLGVLFYWSTLLAFPQMLGLVFIMFALWGNKSR